MGNPNPPPYQPGTFMFLLGILFVSFGIFGSGGWIERVIWAIIGLLLLKFSVTRERK